MIRKMRVEMYVVFCALCNRTAYLDSETYENRLPDGWRAMDREERRHLCPRCVNQLRYLFFTPNDRKYE